MLADTSTDSHRVAAFTAAREIRWPTAAGQAGGEDAAVVLAALGTCRRAEGDFNGAIQALTCARYICEESGSLETAEGALLLMEVGDVCVKAGNGEQAVEAFRAARHVHACLGTLHTRDGARALERLGDALGTGTCGRPPLPKDARAALATFREAREAYDELGGDARQDSARILESSGRILADYLDNADAAIQMFREAYTLRVGCDALDTAAGAALLSRLGALTLRRGGGAMESLELCAEALRVGRQMQTESTVDFLNSLERWVDAHMALGGEEGAARQALEEAQRLRRSLELMDSNRAGAALLMRVGHARLQCNETELAHDALVEARHILRSTVRNSDDTHDVVSALTSIGMVRSDFQGDITGAGKAYEEAWYTRKAQSGRHETAADRDLLIRLGDVRRAIGENMDSPVEAYQDAYRIHVVLSHGKSTLDAINIKEKIGIARFAREERRGGGAEMYWQAKGLMGAQGERATGVRQLSELLLTELNFTWKSEELGGNGGAVLAFAEALAMREKIDEVSTRDGAQLLERLGAAKRLADDCEGAAEAFSRAFSVLTELCIDGTEDGIRVRDLWRRASGVKVAEQLLQKAMHSDDLVTLENAIDMGRKVEAGEEAIQMAEQRLKLLEEELRRRACRQADADARSASKRSF